MRAAPALAALALSLPALPAVASGFHDVFEPDGRVTLPAVAPVAAVAVTDRSFFVADMDGGRVCEYTLAGNPRRCLDELPLDRGPLGITALAFRPPEPTHSEGRLYVATAGQKRIYSVELHNRRVDEDIPLLARSLAVAPYGVLVGTVRPEAGDRLGMQAFHRLTPDLWPVWSFETVRDRILGESPWAPVAVGPRGDLFGAIAGRYRIVRYSAEGRQLYAFGASNPAYEDVVPQGSLPRRDWLGLWSPIVRLDLVGDGLVVTSRVRRGDRAWDVLDVYTLAGSPVIRAVALEGEEPIASAAGRLYTVRRDEPQVSLYSWRLRIPGDVPAEGLMADLPPALVPVRAAAGTVGEMKWDMLRPYLQAIYSVTAVNKNRPEIVFSPDAMSRDVSGYTAPVGDAVTEAVGEVLHTEVGRTLRHEFRMAALDGSKPVTATWRGWQAVMDDPDLRAALRGPLCRQLRENGYPCP